MNTQDFATFPKPVAKSSLPTNYKAPIFRRSQSEIDAEIKSIMKEEDGLFKALLGLNKRERSHMVKLCEKTIDVCELLEEQEYFKKYKN